MELTLTIDDLIRIIDGYKKPERREESMKELKAKDWKERPTYGQLIEAILKKYKNK